MVDELTGVRPRVVVVGGGFCGLSAAFELVGAAVPVTVLEADDELGGLAGSFSVGGVRLEKFYHHWFTSDQAVMDLVADLGCRDRVTVRPSRTGVYIGNRFFRLSTPLELLQFKPLSLAGRIRLGLLALRARRVRDWKNLERITASDWLRSLGGEEVYRVVWEPLLRGKFGDAAPDVSAVWMWNKLKLRGGSRGKAGEERLAYFEGGFAALVDLVAADIQKRGGVLRTGYRVDGIDVTGGRVTGVRTGGEAIPADVVIATPALPILADLLAPHCEPSYTASLRGIRYLANVCVVLELDRSLSSTYWLNVNDPGFPFVAVIEHTNFQPSAEYGGRHLVYLSKYLPENDALFGMTDDALLEFTLLHLRRMFPRFENEWIKASHVWRARYSQPIVEQNYGALIPAAATPVQGLLISTMAQIYPEDRGTNYAIAAGRAIARTILEAR